LGVEVRTGRYAQYQGQLLEFLSTKTDGGVAYQSILSKQLQISKSSLSNVLDEMTAQGLIKRRSDFNNKKRIVLTDDGRKLYNDTMAQQAKFGLPSGVRQYLNRKEPKIKDLFPIQRDFVERGLLYSEDNVCVFAYPASGKTLLAEMAMVESVANGGKALFCTPYRALDWQKFGEFTKSFANLGWKVAITDGDNPVSQSELEAAAVVVATYERVLGALRRGERWLSKVNLLCADEITLLADQERGATIDLLLTFLSRSKERIRIVTLASILGNPLEISNWLGAKTIIENRPLAKMEVSEAIVSEDKEKVFYKFRDGKENVKATSHNAIEQLVETSLQKRQTSLIFVGPRYEAPNLAESLRPLHRQKEELVEKVQEFLSGSFFEKTELTLQACELLKYGVVFHHAGLHKRVRRFIEQMLNEGLIDTVVATGTLSHGVDFRIDNVIIDLDSILKAHPFPCCEYINYKGRAGRPGKSKAASVFIVCNKKESEQVFNRYFVQTPEAAMPGTSNGLDDLYTMTLAAASKNGTSADELSSLIGGTLSARHAQAMKSPKVLLRELHRAGFLRLKQNVYQPSFLGKKTNDANLAPTDVSEVLKLPKSPSIKDLISAAARIDLILKYRRSGARREDPTPMLLDWIEEVPIDSIKKNYDGYWDDGDILQLSEYASMALGKLSDFIPDNRVRRKCELLRTRLRCGVREDLAKSNLATLPLLTRDKARLFGRQLIGHGYGDVLRISKEGATDLAANMSITLTEAAELIAQCKKAVESTKGSSS
jgi:replicative superfamily II helicase